MTQPTSIQAWQEIKAENIPQSQQREILEYLRQAGPHTASEIESIIGCRAHKRMAEMAKPGIGLVMAIGKRRCDVSGRTAIVWSASNVPVQLSLWGAK